MLAVWQFGSPMIIFLAGLRQIPQDLYEAAAIDGAGPARQFFKITLPLLTPVIFFNLILQIDRRLQGVHAGLHHLRRHRRPDRFDPVLHALPLPAGLRLFPHGLRLGDGLGPADHHRRLHGLAFLTSRYWVYYEDEGR